MKAIAIAVLLVAGAVLTGCAADPAPQHPSATPSNAAPPQQVQFDPAALAKSYRVSGGGQYVQGQRDLCNLGTSDSILIEDSKSVDHYDGSTPVTSMTFGGGQITYTTIWPDDVVGTGISAGTGTYAVNADASGSPVSITGHATLTWHDKSTNKTSKKVDDVKLTLTPIPAPSYCQPTG